MLIGSFSPLVKIFQPQWQQKLIDNPELIMDESEKGWDMYIPKPSGAYGIRWSTPKEESSIILIEWLTGGFDGNQSAETDEYGIVQVPIDAADTGEIFAKLQNLIDADDPKAIKAALQGQKANLKGAMTRAREMSDARVWRAISRVYTHIKSQYKRNKESNLGLYDPSPTEYLCVELMNRKLATENQREGKMAARMADMMKDHDATAPKN